MDDRDAPVTRGDLLDLEQRIDGRLDALEQRMMDRTQEMIRDSETRLLTAFYSFADTNQKRLALIESENAAVRGRLISLEDRVLEIEKRLNMPPRQ